MKVYGQKVRVDDGSWVIARIWGEINGQEFLCDVSFEIDGRDAEVEPLWGPNPLDLEFDFFDALYQTEKWPEINKAVMQAWPNTTDFSSISQ